MCVLVGARDFHCAICGFDTDEQYVLLFAAYRGVFRIVLETLEAFKAPINLICSFSARVA